MALETRRSASASEIAERTVESLRCLVCLGKNCFSEKKGWNSRITSKLAELIGWARGNPAETERHGVGMAASLGWVFPFEQGWKELRASSRLHQAPVQKRGSSGCFCQGRRQNCGFRRVRSMRGSASRRSKLEGNICSGRAQTTPELKIPVDQLVTVPHGLGVELTQLFVCGGLQSA